MEMDYREILDSIQDGVYLVDRERRIELWNRGAERISGYSAQDVQGHCCADNILVHIDDEGTQLCVAECPLQATLNDGQVREANVYFRHKDGHRVPVSVRTAPVRDASGNIVAAVEVFSDNTQKLTLLQHVSELEQMALLDPLTGLANRRFMEDRLQVCLDERSRYGWPFGVLFLDIDHFKRINDTYGHNVGDDALKVVARVLEKNLRSFDLAARWGGEEFVVVCKNVDEKLLRETANRLRALVEQSTCRVGSDEIRVTVSVGGALPGRDDTVAGLVKRADALMYQSKKAGRNRVTFEDWGRNASRPPSAQAGSC